jgi:peptidoglycan-N-acetylglucosamine deacetylase
MRSFFQAGRRRPALISLVVILVLAVIGGVTYVFWPGDSVPAEGDGGSSSTLASESSSTTTTLLSVTSTTTSTTTPPSTTVSAKVAAKVIRGVSSTKKLVALTFDDGPTHYTDDILAVLKKHEARATFFVVGKVAADSPKRIAQLRAAGMEVEDHGWAHAHLTDATRQAVLSEITRTETVIGKSKYFRPPYGLVTQTIRDVAGSLGMTLVLWNVDSLDWSSRKASSILSRVKAEVKPGSIVLMHDGGGDRSATVAALPGVISWLRSEGYKLVTVDELVR